MRIRTTTHNMISAIVDRGDAARDIWCIWTYSIWTVYTTERNARWRFDKTPYKISSLYYMQYKM